MFYWNYSSGNEIMDVSGSYYAIPVLKSASGLEYNPKDEADVFADTFWLKFNIPRRELHEHNVEWPHRISNGCIAVRLRGVACTLTVRSPNPAYACVVLPDCKLASALADANA